MEYELLAEVVVAFSILLTSITYCYISFCKSIDTEN